MNRLAYAIIRCVAVFLIACCATVQRGSCQCGESSGRIRHCMTLSGIASGGTLAFVESPQGFTPRFVTVNTSHEQPAAGVAADLAGALRATYPTSFGGVQAVGSALRLPLTFGYEALAGTETGLGIPKPPLSLSGRYDADSDCVLLKWVNGDRLYDEVRVHLNKAPAGTTDYAYTCYGRFHSEYGPYYFVNGIRNGVPSNYAIINVSDHAQEELECPPFFNGVMPNWSSWSTEEGAAKFEQATKDGVDLTKLIRLPQKINGPDDKPFYQLIKTTEPNAQAGIWRKFLGLTPGHTYRLYARLNTLAMDEAKADWSYSLHAAYNSASGADFTMDQLSGKAPLPDGSKGAVAGRIFHYEAGSTTKGKWIQSSTGVPTSETADITLPKGVDTITVWVRHSGASSTGVGIDWVKLEDVTK